MKQACARIPSRPHRSAASITRAFTSWNEPTAARRLRQLYWPTNIRAAPTSSTPSMPVPSLDTDISNKRFLTKSPSLHASTLDQTSSWDTQTLASSDPLNTSSKDLLALVEPLPSSHIPPTSANAIILVTKQFASLLIKDDTFLANILSKLWSQNEALHQVDGPAREAFVLAAVVDRIPVDQESMNDQDGNTGMGSEGIAVCASSDTYLIDPEFDAVDLSPELHTRALKLDEQPPTISIQLQNNTIMKDDNLEIMLPIAQTLFHASEPSVVTLSRWKLSTSPPKKLAQGYKKSSNYGVTLPVSPSMSFVKTTLPLVQLTGPRKIKSVMGNVVRELEENGQIVDSSRFGDIIGQEGGGNTSASSELEEAVAALIAMPGKFASPVGVWALIVPEELTMSDGYSALTRSTDMALENINAGVDVRSNSILQDLVFSGATLRHVLGGGGGWGNKAGLLSLDPHSDYVQKSPDDLFDLDGSDPMSFLRGTASPGDRIVFYADVGHVYTSGRSDVGLEFGVIPSTIDDMPSALIAGETRRASPVRRFPNRFGFLSELGLSIGRRGQSTSLSVRSRLDVPFSRISLSARDGKDEAQ